MGEMTLLIQRASAGEREAFDQAYAHIHAELKSLARRRLNADAGSTLSPTMLVNETWLKLVDRELHAENRAHFFRIAAQAMRQIWIDRLRSSLAPRVCMGVGGLFDYYSGRIPRAPQWLREMGLEWVWRLKQEPGRMWRRYVIGNPLFLFRVWRQARQPERFPLPPGREKRVADQTNADAGQGEAT